MDKEVFVQRLAAALAEKHVPHSAVLARELVDIIDRDWVKPQPAQFVTVDGARAIDEAARLDADPTEGGFQEDTF